jgi:hypothetical protein
MSAAQSLDKSRGAALSTDIDEKAPRTPPRPSAGLVRPLAQDGGNGAAALGCKNCCPSPQGTALIATEHSDKKIGAAVFLDAYNTVLAEKQREPRMRC